MFRYSVFYGDSFKHYNHISKQPNLHVGIWIFVEKKKKKEKKKKRNDYPFGIFKLFLNMFRELAIFRKIHTVVCLPEINKLCKT